MPGDLPLADSMGIEEVMLPELAAQCMDFLDLDDILRVTAVNKRWRQLALEHPTYWRDLTLDLFQSSDPRHVRLFRLRLSRSRDRPVNISLMYHPSDTGSSGEGDILRDISTHLSHIQALVYTTYNDEMVDALLDALAHPAPILRAVKLSIKTTGPNREIRADLFGGSAPSLRSALFGCLDMPDPVPTCLREIEALNILSCNVSDVFRGCPRLRDLHLYHQVTLHPAFREGRSWDAMDLLHIDSGEIGRTWHSMGLPISTVPRIVVRLVYAPDMLGLPDTAESLAALAAHMDGGVAVYISQTRPGLLWIDFQSLSERTAHLERTAILSNQPRPEEESPIPYPGNNLAAGFADRVVILAFALDIWESAICLGDLPALKSLVLSIEDDSIPENPGPLVCPRLNRLVLRRVPGCTLRPIVALAPFAQFARTALGKAPLPLILDLQRVDLLPGEDVERELATFRITQSA